VRAGLGGWGSQGNDVLFAILDRGDVVEPDPEREVATVVESDQVSVDPHSGVPERALHGVITWVRVRVRVRVRVTVRVKACARERGRASKPYQHTHVHVHTMPVTPNPTHLKIDPDRVALPGGRDSE
jgi:hypothetical protein